MSWLIIGEPEFIKGKTQVLCVCSMCGLQKYRVYYQKSKRIESNTHRGCGTDYRNKLPKEATNQDKAYKLLGGKPI